MTLSAQVCHRLFTDVRAYEQHVEVMAQRDAAVHDQHNLCRCKNPPALIVPDATSTKSTRVGDATVLKDRPLEPVPISVSLFPCTLCSGCFLCTPQCRVQVLST